MARRELAGGQMEVTRADPRGRVGNVVDALRAMLVAARAGELKRRAESS